MTPPNHAAISECVENEDLQVDPAVWVGRGRLETRRLLHAHRVGKADVGRLNENFRNEAGNSHEEDMQHSSGSRDLSLVESGK